MKNILLPLFISFLFPFSLLSKEKKDSEYFEIAKGIDIFSGVFSKVYGEYVDEVDSEILINSAIKNMLHSLDPFTSFYAEENVEDLRAQSTGHYGGIGVLFYKFENNNYLVDLIEGAPAYKAGIKIGDILLSVDGKEISNLSFLELSDAIKGEIGKFVSLKIFRESANDTLSFTIEREEVSVSSISHTQVFKDSIGYVYLSGFTIGASEALKKAIIQLKAENNITQLILDLRNNPGGLLHEAVNIVGLFVPNNSEIVTVKGRDSEGLEKYYTDQEPFLPKIPLMVLVNENSASASEIVSGGLQDYDRAIILGEETYGKGLVQNTFELAYNTAIKITTAKYYIPSGRCIQAHNYSKNGSTIVHVDSLQKEFKTKRGRKVYSGKGIKPDVEVIVPEASSFLNYLGRHVFFLRFLNKNIDTFDFSEKDSTSFLLPDNAMIAFKEFIDSSTIKYESPITKSLEELITTMKAENTYEPFEEKISEIKMFLSDDISNFFKRDEKYIEEILTEQLIYRKGGSSERLKYQLANDNQLKKVLHIFSDKTLFDSYLITP